MKRAAVFMAVVIAVSPATGAPFSSTVQPLIVRSDVPTRCKMSPPQTSGEGLNTNFSADSAGGEIDLTDFVDTNTGKTKASNAQIAFPITCTGAHTLTVTTQNGGLVDESVSGSSGGFAARADYALNVSWANTTKSLQTGGASASLDLSQAGPANGNLILNFTIAAGNGPLEAGAYSDAIVVQLNSAQ